jgi:hypothetical protein
MKRVGRKARLFSLTVLYVSDGRVYRENNDNDVKVKKNATTLKPRNCKTCMISNCSPISDKNVIIGRKGLREGFEKS